MIAPNTQTVGQSLTLQCEVATVRDITSRMDIVWSSNGTDLQMMTRLGVNSTTNNTAVYRDSYMIPLLSTTNDSRMTQCKVMITMSPPVKANDNITLDVTASIVTCLLIHCCYTHSSHSYSHHIAI